MFTKLLIANRGEIACRVMRTARRLGIRTCAVYSDADAGALHVTDADEAMHIGAAPAAESYLCAERIIEAALHSGAEAVHPGYGFLSENADFARACRDAGLIFVGPPPEAIEAMGSKAAAKRLMKEAGVPLIPGYHGDAQDDDTLRREADAMGYPVLLKASAGGGGKGMRRVNSAGDFAEALGAARREAKAAFGDSRMLVEKYLLRPRHVELQVFFDAHGEGIHLGERDCSVQRRHQKILEEAPAPGVGPDLRAALGSAAISAARAIGYVGAGTVEFLLDEDGDFYFMEMNTRLQVEHPVTEYITGLDLVEWQLRVASGEPLPLRQEQVQLEGHAIEARIYAEDTSNDFLPATGRLHYLATPVEGRHLRIDSGVRQGDDISVFYDPMIAKLIVWDTTRDRAIRRLATALTEYRIGGTTSNVSFLYNVVSSEPFRQAQLETAFLERHRAALLAGHRTPGAELYAVAALALALFRRRCWALADAADPHSPWANSDGWRVNAVHLEHFALEFASGVAELALATDAAGSYRVSHGDRDYRLRGELAGERLSFELDGHRRRAVFIESDGRYTLFLDEYALEFAATGEGSVAGAADPDGDSLRAPMNARVIAVLAATGDRVQAGAPLVVLEAMKMEQTLRAPVDGVVRGVLCTEGELVDEDRLLVDFEAAAD